MSDPKLASQTIRDRFPDFKPKIAIILGSGLGDVVDALSPAFKISYDEIPGFPPCTVEGHQGFLHLGYLENVPVAIMQGRSHFYEGYFHTNQTLSTKLMMTPIRALKLCGVETLILTNAVGSFHKNMVPGNLVVINDHINFQFTNPLVGPNDNEFGPRFVGMEDAYDPALRQKIQEIAAKLDIPVHEGVFFGVLGPMFETPAEIRAYKILGADVVGMSIISEVITARHCGLKVAAISAITNMAAGMSSQKLSHDVTLEGAKLGVNRLSQLIRGFINHVE